MSLTQRMTEVEKRIQAACERSGRSRQEVQLIAVTKYVSLETTRQVLDLGLHHIGENRWQDAQQKYEALGDRGTWHFIGHLQTNKVKEIVGRFEWIHSLDRLSLAKELNKRTEQDGVKQACLIQLNISGEESKHGLPAEQLFDFAAQASQLGGIEIAGLMTMAPIVDNPEEARPIFRKLKELQMELKTKGLSSCEHLSMGMSGDFEVAIEEGATMIRLGSILVGRE